MTPNAGAFLKKLNRRYKRLRRRGKGVEQADIYQLKQEILGELEALSERRKIDLYYADEASVSLTPHYDNVMRVRVNKNKLLPEYVSAFLRTSYGRHGLGSKVATSAGNHSINQNGIASIQIPYPSIRAQEIFVNTVRSFQQTRTRLVSGTIEAQNIFSSLLSRAFTGELTAEGEAANAEVIPQMQALYERLPQLILLAFLHEKSGRAKKRADACILITALMKYVFLFQMEAAARRRLYYFVPYHYGPFARELYTDLQVLSEQGFITMENGDEERTRISLTKSGDLQAIFSDLPEDIKDDVSTVLDTYGHLTHKELLRQVYEKYPAYTVKSRLNF